ncbi:Uncharacterised protein [Pseudomonas aeruginosa]|nr:Uncharacterised protein [Pseudomonas aeruginosa]
MTMVPVREFDDDLGHRLARLHVEVLQDRQVVDPLVRVERRADPHRAAVHRMGDARTEQFVDAVDDALGSGEVRAVEVQRQAVALVEAARHRAFDGGAGRDTSGGRYVDGDLRAVAAFGVEAADHQVALGDRVDLAVDTFQRSHQQAAAAQALGVADGRHGDVDRLARLGERRQVGMHRYRGDVLQLHVADVGRHLDAELRQHVVEGLQGERRLRGLVAAAAQADHQAIADQLVGPHALDAGDILQPLGLGRAGGQEQRGEGQQVLELGHRERPQNGHSGLRKKRSSQPG